MLLLSSGKKLDIRLVLSAHTEGGRYLLTFDRESFCIIFVVLSQQRFGDCAGLGEIQSHLQH